MNLIEILDVNLIDLEMEASSKDEVIHQLCSLLYVEWESLDDQPVRLIFLLAAPTNELEKTHLQMLAQLASVLAYKEHVDALMECETKEQFFKLFESYFDEFTKRKEENK